MFNICSTSSNMWIWSYDHPPQDRFTRRALLDAKYDRAPQVRQPGSKVNVCYPVRIRKGSLFVRTRAQFFHSNIHITTP